jgi:hypothetical protein
MPLRQQRHANSGCSVSRGLRAVHLYSKWCSGQDEVVHWGDALWDAQEQQRKNAYLEGRARNTQRYKPGTQEVLLMFCDQRGEVVYRFPYYDRFKHVLEPLLDQVCAFSCPASCVSRSTPFAHHFPDDAHKVCFLSTNIQKAACVSWNANLSCSTDCGKGRPWQNHAPAPRPTAAGQPSAHP